MYLDTLVYVLFVFYLLYQYHKTREKGNIAFLVPLSMRLVLNDPWLASWPDWAIVAYRLSIVAACGWAFWYYLRDFRRREAKAKAEQEEQRKLAKEAAKAEKKAKQKAANAHQNPAKNKKKK